jgi:two-component system chemotaxis response regulator CheB
MYKVLIVDDSDVARQMLLAIFALSDDFSVIGVAENGQDGFEKTCRLKPDLVTMDLHMPVMDGYEAVERIMYTEPVPILVITSYKEAETAFKCIALGALDVIDKPGLYDLDDDSFVEEFLDRARLFATTRVIRRIAASYYRDQVTIKPQAASLSESDALITDSDYVEVVSSVNPTISSVNEPLKNRAAFHLVAIASSTGGPQALCEILSGLPPDFPAAVLIVQHLSAGFEDGFAKWLGGHTELPVQVAWDGAPLIPGTVLIAPPGKHVIVSESKIVKYFDAPPVASHIPSARYLFESAAAVYGSQSTGVILTGMGADGSEEIGRIKNAGGLTIGQDEASSVIYGMPGVAAKLGTVSEIRPIEEIAGRIVSWVCR